MQRNRRAFLMQTAVSGLAASASVASAGSAHQQSASSSNATLKPIGANDRIRVGAIGTGSRCRYLLSLLSRLDGNQIVAVCDVYEPNRQEARSKFAPAGAEYSDFRKLLDDRDIDAVVIGTPDHWHVPILTAALQAGKDVYVEKPVTHAIEDGEPLIKLVADSKHVVQTGMQQRSWPHIIEAKALLDSGVLGQITLIESHWYQNYLPKDGPPVIDESKLDWQSFLGSAPSRPLDPLRFTNWRYYWDYGGGAFTDLLTHWIDVVHWYMGVNLPDTAFAMGSRYKLLTQECPDTMTAVFEYPAKFQVVFYSSLVGILEGGGIMIRGTKGALRVEREGYAYFPEPSGYSESLELPLAAQQVRRTRADGTRFHMANFLDCVRSRKTPNAPIWAGIDAARPGHMANISLKENRPVTASSLKLDVVDRSYCS